SHVNTHTRTHTHTERDTERHTRTHTHMVVHVHTRILYKLMSLPMVLALTRKNTHTVNVLKFNSSVHEYLQTAIIYLRNKYFGCIFLCASVRERERERERGNV